MVGNIRHWTMLGQDPDIVTNKYHVDDGRGVTAMIFSLHIESGGEFVSKHVI